MSGLTHAQYDALERALIRGARVALVRRGIEQVVLPLRLRAERGREVVDVRHPTTGDEMSLYLDELDAVETIG